MRPGFDWEVAVVGGGAAGLLSAARAAQRGLKTVLLEKNRRPGVKILMSGGTRCNLTQNTDKQGIIRAFENGKFLHSALAALDPKQLVALVEAEGVPTKIEETGKIFPVSNKATDILAAFTAIFERSGAVMQCESPVSAIEKIDGGFRLILPDERPTDRAGESHPPLSINAEKIILTTGGRSYPGSGTTGDGYAWCQSLGHTIVPPRPALVPITSGAAWVADLKGITIPDMRISVYDPPDALATARTAPVVEVSKKNVLATQRGSVLFAHFGLSGPAILDVSRAVTGHSRPQSLLLVGDLLPEVREDQLLEQLAAQCRDTGRKQIYSLMPAELPRRLCEMIVSLADLDGETRAAELSKAGRQQLAACLKRLAIPVSGTRGFAKAEVTAGGVSLAEVDSKTMQSKLMPGLYFAGELLDLDGQIGGYNFQAAFSTGWLAGESV